MSRPLEKLSALINEEVKKGRTRFTIRLSIDRRVASFGFNKNVMDGLRVFAELFRIACYSIVKWEVKKQNAKIMRCEAVVKGKPKSWWPPCD